MCNNACSVHDNYNVVIDVVTISSSHNRDKL